ncbi:hypothetical protein Tco_0085879 [Tanacetum coccineum]
MLAICATDMPVVFKAPKTSSKVESVSQGTNPRAKPGYKKLLTSSKQPFVFSSEATKGGSSKAPPVPKLAILRKGKSPARPWTQTQANLQFLLLFKDLDLPEDDLVIVVDDTDEDEEDEVHATISSETEDTSSQKHKLERKKNKAKAEAALLKAQPSFPSVGQLNELLVKSLQTEFSKYLSAHDFSSSLPTELKDLPSKFNDLTKEVKGLKIQVHNLEIELPGDLKEIPPKLDNFTKTITSLTSQVAELKTLQWELPAEFLSLPAQVLDFVLSKAGDQSVPSAGQADTIPAEGEKNTNQATISQLFQRRAEKNAEKENLNNQQPKPTISLATTIIPPVITTITNQMQSFPQNPQKGSSQPEGEHIKKDKGKKAMYSKDAEEVSTESDSDDETTHVPEQINAQKKIDEEAKAEAFRCEGEMRKEELIDLLGSEVVNKYYNDKLQKGPITLKVYREDDTSEIIYEFKASDLHLGEWREVVKARPNKKGKGWVSIYKQIQERMDYLRTTEAELGIDLDRPLSKQDHLDRLNDLANKKRKHADDIHDFFRANKRLKSSVQYEDHPADFRDVSNTMLYNVQKIFFRLYQGPGLDDHARTFCSLLLAEIDKRNLNPLKQMRVIEQLR